MFSDIDGIDLPSEVAKRADCVRMWFDVVLD